MLENRRDGVWAPSACGAGRNVPCPRWLLLPGVANLPLGSKAGECLVMVFLHEIWEQINLEAKFRGSLETTYSAKADTVTCKNACNSAHGNGVVPLTCLISSEKSLPMFSFPVSKTGTVIQGCGVLANTWLWNAPKNWVEIEVFLSCRESEWTFLWGRAGRSGLCLVVPATSFWGVLTHLSLSLPPYVDAMESSYGQAEYNEVMSSHVTLKPEAVLSSSSCTMASFTLFLEMDKSGVMQSPEEVEKKRKSTKYALK